MPTAVPVTWLRLPIATEGALCGLIDAARAAWVADCFRAGVRSRVSTVAFCGERANQQRRDTVDLAIERTAVMGRSPDRLVSRAAYPRAGRQSHTREVWC